MVWIPITYAKPLNYKHNLIQKEELQIFQLKVFCTVGPFNFQVSGFYSTGFNKNSDLNPVWNIIFVLDQWYLIFNTSFMIIYCNSVNTGAVICDYGFKTFHKFTMLTLARYSTL